MDKTKKPIGSQWEISARRNAHGFNIGEKITILSSGKYRRSWFYNATNGKQSWAVTDDELRPLPPPVAEERTFTLAEMVGCWRRANTHHSIVVMRDYFQKTFNITLPE